MLMMNRVYASVSVLLLGATLCCPMLSAQPGKEPPVSETAPAPSGFRPDQYESGVVAQVNREVITRGQVWATLSGSLAGADEATRKDRFDRALVEMVRNVLLDQATQKLQLRVDERFVRTRIESEKEEVGGEENYRAALMERGVTEREYMSDLMRQSERTFLLRSKAGLDRGIGTELRPEYEVIPTVSEVRAEYQKRLSTEFSRPAEREIWFLAITRGSTASRLPDGTTEPGTNEKALALAQKLRQDLLTGADFGVLAERFSPASADEKGYFGWQQVETSSLAQEVLDWAFDAARRPGDLSEPLPLGGANPRGFVLVRVSGIREASVVPFAEAQGLIAQRLKAKRTAAALALVEAKLVEESYISPPQLKTLLSRSLREKAAQASGR